MPFLAPCSSRFLTKIRNSVRKRKAQKNSACRMQTLEAAFFLCVLTEKEHPAGPLCHAGCSLIPYI
jgi:hypothetical protein